MNVDSLETWKNGVKEHLDNVSDIISDRRLLKDKFEIHIKSFFKYDSIKYNRDFSQISLYYQYNVSPVIRNKNMGELGMDWIIGIDYDDDGNKIIVVELYPFGLPEETTIDED